MEEKRYFKLKIGDQIRVLEAGTYLLHFFDNTMKIIDKELRELASVKLPTPVKEKIEIVAEANERGVVFKLGDKTLNEVDIGGVKISAEPAEPYEAEIIESATEVSAVTAQAKMVEEEKLAENKYVKLSEEIAAATIDTIKTQLETLHAENRVKNPVVLSPNTFTKMYIFASELGSRISADTDLSTMRKILAEHKDELADILESIAKDAEYFDGKTWNKMNQNREIDTDAVISEMLTSDIVVLRFKELALEASKALRENNPEAIMRSYAKAIRLVGLVSPGVLISNYNEYYSRLDKILLEDAKPRNKIEASIKKLFPATLEEKKALGLVKEKVVETETKERAKVAASA